MGKLDINIPEARYILFKLCEMLQKDWDGDIVEIDGVKYIVDAKNNVIKRYVKILGNKKENSLQIITLCGSGKFKSIFKDVEIKLSLEGNLVFSPFIFNFPDTSILTPEIHEILDKVHREKINISDIIYIINKDGYIGNDTNEEIEYARSIGKKIMYLEEESSIWR